MAGLRSLRRKPTTDEAVKELQVHAEQFDKLTILDGQEIIVVVPSGANSAQPRHSLGRAYRGAIVVGVSSTAAPFSEFYASDADAAEAAGLDTRQFCQVACNLTTTAPHTLRLWVY